MGANDYLQRPYESLDISTSATIERELRLAPAPAPAHGFYPTKSGFGRAHDLSQPYLRVRFIIHTVPPNSDG